MTRRSATMIAGLFSASLAGTLTACPSISDLSAHGGDASADSAPALDAACAYSDGGTCGPRDQPGFAPTWVPPRSHQGACSAAQISFLASQCAPGTAGSQACTTFDQQASNQACLGCLYVSVVTDTAWGPLVIDAMRPNAALVLNGAGCITLLDPASKPCAEMIEAAFQCQVDACLGDCPDAGGITGCEIAATSCSPCAGYVASTNDCVDQIRAGGGPAAPCFQSDYTLQIEALFTAFCGS
jgi:hypothetical protein